jgi:hypothetical protein
MHWLRRDRREGREGIKYTRADVNAAINESTINNMARKFCRAIYFWLGSK